MSSLTKFGVSPDRSSAPSTRGASAPRKRGHGLLLGVANAAVSPAKHTDSTFSLKVILAGKGWEGEAKSDVRLWKSNHTKAFLIIRPKLDSKQSGRERRVQLSARVVPRNGYDAIF